MTVTTPAQTPIPRAAGDDDQSDQAGGCTLPELATPLTPTEVLDRVDLASRRGRMPGFGEGGFGGQGGLFHVAAHGHPFDAVLIARYEGAGGGGRLTFCIHHLRKMRIAFAVVLAFTIWPGVYFMDLLIPGEWGWIPTWWWYIPITALPIPWLWRRIMHKSDAAVDESARKAIEKIAAELAGSPPPRAAPDA